jgi:hypothetical protein
MPRKCTICEHKDRNKIDSALAVNGASLRSVAVRFGLSLSSVKRHVSNGHIAEKIMQAQHVNEVIEADGILEQMQRVKQETWIIHKESREAKNRDGNPDPDNELALKAIARLEKQIELESKVLGVTKDPNVTVVSQMSDDEIERKAREILERRRV